MRRLSCSLPEEIVMEILLRLPPESLIRFKCVCKSWYVLITEPSFAHEHLHFNNNRLSSSASLFLNWLPPSGEEPDPNDELGPVRSLVTITDSDDGKDSNIDDIPCVIEHLNLSIIPQRGKWHFYTVSHCDGIIWLSPLSFYDGETVLYNPAIRDFKLLPGSCLAEAYSLGRFTLVQGEGFGYDSKVNDYKFIRILSNWRSNECIAELYTMASDSWREIRSDMKFGHALCGGNRVGVCCKGVFYWVVKMPNIILAFDMSSDEFHSIQLPSPHNVDQVDALPSTRKTLAVWNESVALLISEGVLTCIEIWVMDDYHGGVKAPWIKHLTIGPLVNLLYRPIMFWRSDELLMAKRDEGIVSYNLSTQKFRNLPTGVSPNSCYASIYTKSLVSVRGGNSLNWEDKLRLISLAGKRLKKCKSHLNIYMANLAKE